MGVFAYLRGGLAFNPGILDRFGSHRVMVRLGAGLPQVGSSPDAGQSTHWLAGPGTSWVVRGVGLLHERC